ncbi:hypothetical protein BGX30_006092, partial [Mortierella sp. GBA39]
RLATKEDFENGLNLSLQDMLDLTSNHALNCNDAWAIGDTDNAFAINDFVGVQRSHAPNDWNYGWVNLFEGGHGTYVYMLGDPYLIKNLTDLKIDRENIATVPVTNSTSSPITTGVKYTETESQATTITKAWAIGLKLSTEFELLGHKFSLETSFKTSSEEANSKSTSTSSEFTAEVAVPPNSVYELLVYQEISTQTRLYGLDLALGSDHPEGSLGKATQSQGTWDTFFRIESVLKGKEKQTIQYQVDVTDVVTKIELKNGTPSPSSDRNAAQAEIISRLRS